MAKIRKWFLDLMTPVARFLGKLRNPFLGELLKIQKSARNQDICKAMATMKPGSVILTITEGELSNLFIPGEWKHSALYIGNERCIECVGKGVVENSVYDMLSNKKQFCVLEPMFADGLEMLSACEVATTMIGMPYDYTFTPNAEAFYCSELIWYAYDNVVEESPFTPREVLGVETVLPQDYFDADHKWQMTYESGTYSAR